MIEIDVYVLAVLFFVAVGAGCFDAIAGGGGLVTVPAMMLMGLDPVAAIATNKLQASAGTLSATTTFARKGLIDWKLAIPLCAIAGFAAVLGALSVSLLSKPLLTTAIPFVLISIALYFGFSAKITGVSGKSRVTLVFFALAIIPVIGFYDGIFGPGAGSIYMAAFVGLLGFGVVKATAHTKVANCASNLGGFFFFASTGFINWSVGFTMAFGAMLGAYVGSMLAIRMGAKLIRPLLVIISCLMAVRLFINPDNLFYKYITIAP